MVTQLAPSTQALLEPQTPPWAQRMALRLAQLFVSVFPVQPVRLWPVAPADLPPAKDWPGSLVFGTDGKLYLSNGTSWVAVGAAAPAPFRGALVTLAADQIGQDYTGLRAVAWNSEVYDTSGFHDNAVNPTRLTVPAGVTRVRLYGSLFIQNVAAGQWAVIAIDKNAAYGGTPGTPFLTPVVTGGAYTSASVTTAVLNVVPGDYFELRLQMQVGDPSVDLYAPATSFAMEVVS